MSAKYSLLIIATGSVFAYSDELDKNVTIVRSTIVIIQATGNTADYIRSAICPSETEQLEQAQRKEHLAILKAEEQLNECLVANSATSPEEDEFPSQCQKVTELFAIAAGHEALDLVKKEFNAARSEIVETQQEEPAPQGMSTTTKVLIGGAMVVGGGVVLVVAAPVVLPGTVIAAKAIAIKTAVGSAVGYVTTTNGTQIALCAAGALEKTRSYAKDTKDATVEVAQEARREFVNLPLSDQIIITAQVIEVIEHTAQRARPYVYQTEEEELQHYLKLRVQRASLRERIRQARRKST